MQFVSSGWGRRFVVGWIFSSALSIGGLRSTEAEDSSSNSPQFPSGPIAPAGSLASHEDSRGNAPAIPASFPDKFAWMLFARINQKASHQVDVAGTTKRSNSAVWESWPDDDWTFPSNPVPANPPVWPTEGEGTHRKSLRSRALNLFPARSGADVGKLPPGGFTLPDGSGVGEEVRRNKPAFDYIINNSLWYRQGIAAFFAKAAAVASNEVRLAQRAVNFPRDSIEVKGNWIVISEADKPRYHWNYNTSGQLLGLVAFHVISKDLPNWFWCTFEQVDNPGRGDYIGIHDSFGASPAHTPSHTDKLFQKYPAEQLKANVLELLGSNHFEGEWLEQWKNYRLKGSQVDFIDSAGRPLLLGNSVTEGGFVPTASCITCHSRAAVDAQGKSSFPLFGEMSNLPLIGISQTNVIYANVLTYNGIPNPSWYFQEAGQNAKPPGLRLLNLQTDFVWAIPFKASAAK